MRKLFFLLLLLLLLNLSKFTVAYAQDTLFNGRKNKIGLVAGNGIQYLGQLLGNENRSIAIRTDYYYQITFYQFQYYRSWVRHRSFGIDILAQPQYNVTKYKKYRDYDNTEYLNSFEAGINLGLVFRKNVLDDALSFYVLISSGPHYLSETPLRQSNGYVFSNNIALGINARLYKTVYLDIRPGLRHVSNAGIKLPNAGINDITLTEGLWIMF